MSKIDDLQKERYALFKAGLSPVDWGRMTKWQRLDILLRHQKEAADLSASLEKDKLGGLVAILVKGALRI